MTDCTQEFNEASKNKVRMRIFFQSKNLYLRFFRNKRHEAFLNKKIYQGKPLFASENQTRSIFASRKGKLILKHASEEPRYILNGIYIDLSARFEISQVTRNP